MNSNSVLFCIQLFVPFCHFLGPLRFPFDLFGFSALCFENSLLLSGFPLGIGNSVCKAEETGFLWIKNREAIGTKKTKV